MVKRKKPPPDDAPKRRKVEARFDGQAEADIRTNHPPASGHFCPNCTQKFPSETALKNHIDYKLYNKNHQVILRSEWARGRMMAVCRDTTCCFSTPLLTLMDEHMEEVHSTTKDEIVHIIVNNKSVRDELAPHQCPKCVKNFVSRKKLSDHYGNCRGRLLYKCSFCTLTFNLKSEFVDHIETHEPDTSFSVTGFFCGKKQVEGSGGRKHIERTVVVKDPHVRLMSDVFTRRVKKELEKILSFENEVNGHILARIIARVVIEKTEENGTIIRKPFESTTNLTKLSDIYTIRQFIRKSQDRLQRNLTILEGTPSGFRVSEISSLTISTSPAPSFRGGCGEILDTSTTAIMRRGLFKISGDGEGCLIDSILFSLFSKELFSEIRRELETDCMKDEHTPSCPCYKMAKTRFDELAGVSSTWERYRDRVNLSGMTLPGGVEDVQQFDRNNPGVHVNTFIDYCGRFYQLFKSETAPSQKVESHVNLVYREGFNARTNEIEGHWFPVSNISRFGQRIYRKEGKVSRQNTHGCHQCGHRFSMPKSLPKNALNYHDIYCDIKTPSWIEYSDTFNTHLRTCGAESPTEVRAPENSYFIFQNYKAAINNRFSAFYDFECFSVKEDPLCFECDTLLEACSSTSAAEKIKDRCLKSGHFQQEASRCGGCRADLKSFLENTADCCHEGEKYMDQCRTCYSNIDATFGSCEHERTKKIKSMEPSGYHFLVYDNYQRKVVTERSYNLEESDDQPVVQNFYETLYNDVLPMLEPDLVPHAPMALTEKEEELFNKSTRCHLCNRKVWGSWRTRDHCHVTGEFRGLACKGCNINMKLSRNINFYAHNSTRFDSHLLVKNIDVFDSWSVIPRNKESFTTLKATKKGETKDENVHITFKDSLSFLGGSLDRMTALAVKSGSPFNILKESGMAGKGQDFCQKKFELLLRKGVFPYDYMSGPEVFKETSLPPREDFSNSLGVGSELSEEDYKHAETVWREFNMQSMMDYSELYCRLDVYLLCEAFINFSDNAFSTFGLYAEHYNTLPAFALDCCKLMLKRKGVKIELIQDLLQLEFVNRAKRGGLCSVLGPRLCFSRKGAEYIKKTLREDFKGSCSNPVIKQLCRAVDRSLMEELPDPNDDFEILYLDANNLYGLAQTLPLPIGGFRFADEIELRKIKGLFNHRNEHVAEGEIMEWDDLFSPEEGFYVECDIEIPDDLQEELEAYPPAPHHKTVEPEHLSQFCQSLISDTKSQFNKSTKLCVTLEKREKYVVHSTLLDFYSRLGCHVRNIDQVLRFEQAPFLKDWVDLNTQGRKEAQLSGDEVKRSFFKLMVNSVFGKFSENLLTQTNMKIITTMRQLETAMHSPLYKSHSIVSEKLMLVEEYKPSVTLDRPAQIGVSILELSKLTMLEFYYKDIKPTFGQRAQPLYTDTDSLIIRLRTSDVDKDLEKISHVLDTSNFPPNHRLYSTARASQLGYFKSEVGAEKIHVATAIRSKCYQICKGDDFEAFNKLKGVNRDAVARLTLGNYLRTILLNDVQYCTFNKISSRKHSVHVDRIIKRSLASFDDKVQLSLCGVHNRKYGYKNFSDFCKCPFSKIVR